MIAFSELKNSDLLPGEIYQAGSSNNYFTDEVISNIFKFDNLKGIGNQGGIRRTRVENNKQLKDEEAFVILLNTHQDPQWPNKYDRASGILTYFGDNQDPAKEYLDTKQRGNLAFKKYFQRSYNSKKEYIAPFFYFERVNSKDVRYIGIAVPYVQNLNQESALKLEPFSKNGEQYYNYEASFSILEVSAPRQWLYDLKIGNIHSKYAPTAWYDFLENRNIQEKHNDQGMYLQTIKDAPSNTGYRMTAYRKTQADFRTNLLKRESSCQLCHLSIEPLLIASHIIPWAVADETQKNDVNNGLLLCINHDALFDKGYISFDQNGKIIISDMLPSSYYETLNIQNSMSINLLPDQEQYMEFHRNSLLKYRIDIDN